MRSRALEGGKFVDFFTSERLDFFRPANSLRVAQCLGRMAVPLGLRWL